MMSARDFAHEDHCSVLYPLAGRMKDGSDGPHRMQPTELNRFRCGGTARGCSAFGTSLADAGRWSGLFNTLAAINRGKDPLIPAGLPRGRPPQFQARNLVSVPAKCPFPARTGETTRNKDLFWQAGIEPAQGTIIPPHRGLGNISPSGGPLGGESKPTGDGEALLPDFLVAKSPETPSNPSVTELVREMHVESGISKARFRRFRVRTSELSTELASFCLLRDAKRIDYGGEDDGGYPEMTAKTTSCGNGGRVLEKTIMRGKTMGNS
nr:vinorine synthase-like [Ipomoea batatas]